jgi:hypothetical protein
MNCIKWFLYFNFLLIGVGVILTLCIALFDDPRKVNGRKRGNSNGDA